MNDEHSEHRVQFNVIGTRQLIATLLLFPVGYSPPLQLMDEPHRPLCFRCGDCGQLPHPSPIPPEDPFYEDHRKPAPPAPPAPPIHYQVFNGGPGLTTRPTSYTDDPNLFRVQERECLSRPTSWFRIQIDIDLPHNPQAIGGRCPPPQSSTPHRSPPLRSLPPPPPWQLLPSSSASHGVSPSQQQLSHGPRMTQISPGHTQGVLVDLLFAAAGSINNHPVHQHQVKHHSRYTYPPPKVRRESPEVASDGAQQHHAAHPKQRGARGCCEGPEAIE